MALTVGGMDSLSRADRLHHALRVSRCPESGSTWQVTGLSTMSKSSDTSTTFLFGAIVRALQVVLEIPARVGHGDFKPSEHARTGPGPVA
jgi:hypothetical protein